MSVGELTVKTKRGEVKHRLVNAEFGVRRFTDVSEVWFEGCAEASSDDDASPRIDAEIFVDSFDEAAMIGRELTIKQPELFPDLSDRSNATFSVYSGDPQLLGPCQITFLSRNGDQVLVRWEATLDPTLGEDPSLAEQLTVEGSFKFHGITEIDLPSSTANVGSSCLLLTICLAIFITGFIYLAKAMEWPTWAGVVVGLFVGYSVNSMIES